MLFRMPKQILPALLLACCFAINASGLLMMHPSFIGAGQKEGLEIWRIESFMPVAVPKSDYGKFHEGDSYIILSTKEDKTNKGKFNWDIYFWLGKSTTQDESGTAAVLSVELDDGLGGSPVQHREEQGKESKDFLALFPEGVKYLPDGVPSGFRPTDINAPGHKSLYQIKGKKNVRVRLVKVDVTSLNNGDCFVLDAGVEVFVWVGSKARDIERLKAIQIANEIRDVEQKGRGKVIVIDASSSLADVREFFKQLGGGSQSDVPNATADDDQDYEDKQAMSADLYEVSDASGELVFKKVTEKPLKHSMLKSDECFVLDTLEKGVYVWVGRKSTNQEKIEALKRGMSLFKKHPRWTMMVRVVDGGEPTAFKEYFNDW